MQTIYIDDNGSVDFKDENAISSKLLSIYGVTRATVEIINNISRNIDIIFINLFLQTKESSRAKLPSIDIIKCLRILGVDSHIILYSSPISKSELTLRIGSSIIQNNDVSISSYRPEEITNLEELKMNVFDRDKNEHISQLLDGFKPPEQLRHDWANWWGLKQLIDTYNAIITGAGFAYGTKNTFGHKLTAKKYGIGLSYPKELNSELEDVNSLIAMYIYGNSFQIETKIIQEIKREIALEFDPEKEEKYYLKSLEERYLKLKKDYPKLLFGYRELFSPDLFKNLHKHHDFFLANKKRILLIDDKADMGWGMIFNQIINGDQFHYLKEEQFGDKVSNEGLTDINCFLGLTPNNMQRQIKNHDELDNWISNQLRSILNINKPNVILLDLRLLTELETFDQVQDFSGFRVLQMLSEQYSHIPVMIVTSSQKWNESEELKEMGIKYYWNKQPLDIELEKREEQNEVSMANYLSFLEGIKLCIE